MSLEIVGTIDVLVKLGFEIKKRLQSLNQATEELQLLTTNLMLLLKIFESPQNEALIKSHIPEFVHILDVLQSIAQSCTKCAKALDIDLARATDTTIAETRRKKLITRLRTFHKIPDILAEINRKAAQLQQIYTTVSTVIVHDIRTQQGQMTRQESSEPGSVVKELVPRKNLLELEFSTDFAGIDQMVGNLIIECNQLRQQLQKATLIPDASAVQAFQAQNAEAVSFWKDRFQNGELSASALRYETIYVSWARFVHIVETSFALKKMPTAILETGAVDHIRQQGSRYSISQSGERSLSSIRPLWLPVLRTLLDPLHRGYVKPQDYFNLLHDSSLSESLRKLVLESGGYGTVVECERSSDDLPLQAVIESPSDHVGWISAQIVSVPTANELGIVTEPEIAKSSSDFLFASFSDIAQDVHIYVRYLQTGQIERKSLSTQVRPIRGISLGAPLSICYELESGDHAWSSDLRITEFKACYGGRYTITAGVGSTATVFSTGPFKDIFKNLSSEDNSSDPTIPEFSYALSGPSKIFNHPPKIGEKIQIEFEGLWFDSRVTLVDGDEIEYTDWNILPKQAPTNIAAARGNGKDEEEVEEEEEEGSDGLFFSEEQLKQLGKGKRRLWRPWMRDIYRCDIRPYRCFHVGDLVEAPVMYPDFRHHYHLVDDSGLYLPARIIDVEGDQYVVEFNPAFTVHKWWPGRMAKDEQVDLVPGSGVKVRNPYDFNRVTLSMDLIRPFSTGPRPVLGVQSMKPSGWNSFQGVRLRNLEDLLEQSLWN